MPAIAEVFSPAINRFLALSDQDVHMRWPRSFGLVIVMVVAACSSVSVGDSLGPSTTTTDGPRSTESGPGSASTGAQSNEAPPASGSEVSFDESYLSLGPGRSFPVLDDPPMVPASSASWLDADDVVLGVVRDGVAQAFPAAQLAFHHVVNTTVAGEPYLVTY